MRHVWPFLIIVGVGIAGGGCAPKQPVPMKLEVTDLTTGQRYTTYRSMTAEGLAGFGFQDLGSGDRIVLRDSFRLHALQLGGQYDAKSPEAVEYQEALVNSALWRPTPQPAGSPQPQPSNGLPARRSPR
jgi:hypothetical protein